MDDPKKFDVESELGNAREYLACAQEAAADSTCRYASTGKWKWEEIVERFSEEDLDPKAFGEFLGRGFLPYCNHCGEYVPHVVEVGEEPFWDSATASICISCAEGALKALREAIEAGV